MSTAARALREEPAPRALTREQARALLDQRARAELDMSGDEFIRAREAGELDPTTSASSGCG